MASIDIMFLASNPSPSSRLAIDEEAREIQLKIRASEHRDSLNFKTRWAVRFDDLLQALNEERPVVVHFSGHGSGARGIVLHDDGNGEQLIASGTLRRMFKTLKNDLRVVVLNSCYTSEQAKAIVEVIDCVVGMKSPIGDEAARRFAASFYRAIGFGCSVQNAFEQGQLAIESLQLNQEDIPELFVRNGVDAERLIVIPAR